MELIIYNQMGEQKAVISPSENSQHTKALMGDNVLGLSFKLYDYIPLDVNDYIDFMGERFMLMKAYKPVMTSTVEYQYDVQFYGIESQLKNALMLKLVDGEDEPTFPLTDTALVHLQLVVDNVNRIQGVTTWVIGQVITTDNKDITYDRTNCFDALGMIAEAFDTEWWIEGNTINIGRCENGDLLTLGYDQGLKNVAKVENEEVPFFTRLYPLGSTRNIDRDTYGHVRLQLPGGVKYVEQNTHYGVVEHAEEDAFSGIYPRRVGYVGSVRFEQATVDGREVDIYYFTDPDIPFNPNDYEMPGLTKKIRFDGGSLNGREFEVNWHEEAGEFELINQYPYENQQLPGGSMVPRPGDPYVLFDVKMPTEYYALAEQEYRQAVDDLLERYAIDTAAYKAPTDYIYFAENNIQLRLGRRVRLVSPEYFDAGYRDSRITKFSRKVVRPTDADIECAYAVSPGRMARLESSVVQIEAIVRQQAETQIGEILKSWDSGDPTEYNIFSARRSLREFLSKTQSDEAQGYINFVRGIGLAAKLLNDILRVGDDGDPGNQNVFSALRTQKEIEDAVEGLDGRYLRKDIEDAAQELIYFLKGIDVKDVATFSAALSSPDFVSGLLDGKGWAIMLKDYVNAAGETERKSYAEFDDVTVRGALRVLELVINQLRGENDNYVFSGMMKVAEIDPATKTIFLDTAGGMLYNPFKEGDILVCQHYGGIPTEENDHRVTKQYEFIVADAGLGGFSPSRLDWIRYDKFTGDLSDVKPGDILCRVDNDRDPERKGVIMTTSIGEGAPYIDVVHGLKTDPANALKVRLGRLTGVYNHWFGWLKGFGAFMQNLYAIGEFHFNNGENVRTRLDIMENLFRVGMQKTRQELSEDANFLRNAAFTENMDSWQVENDVRTLTLGGLPLMINGNLYMRKDSMASVVDYEGRNILRIRNAGIRQLNQHIRKPDSAESTLYLTFRFRCTSPGELTCGFEVDGRPAGGTMPFISESIPAGLEFVSRTYSGTWDGLGDFVMAFTGDIYVDLLAVTCNPLDDYKIEVSTAFEQTHERIVLEGRRVDLIEEITSDLRIELDAAGQKITILGERVDENETTTTKLGLDLDLVDERLTLYADKTDEINGTVLNQGLRLDTAENQIELFSDFKNSAEGTMTSLGIRMNSAEGALDTYAERLNSLDGSMISIGNRMNAAEGTIDTYVEKTNEITGDVTSLTSRMSVAEGRFSQYVLTETYNGFKTNAEDTLSRHWTAIEQTEKMVSLAVYKAVGFPVYKDLRFDKGLNDLRLYNASGGTAVTLKYIPIWSGIVAPTATNYPASMWNTTALKQEHVGDVYKNEASGMYYTYSTAYTWQSGAEFVAAPAEQLGVVRVSKVSGASSLGLGGFSWPVTPRPNAVFQLRFTARIPTGHTVNFGTALDPSLYSGQWITSQKGSGEWREYKYELVFAGDESLEDAAAALLNIYLTRDAGSSSATVVTWYLCNGTVFDLSGYEDPISYINLSEGLAKIKADRIELEGTTTINGNFSIDEQGRMHADKGGSIGGFEIATGRIGRQLSTGGTSYGDIDGMSLSAYQLRFGDPSAASQVAIGSNVYPPSAGGFIGALDIRINRPKTSYDGADNTGVVIDVQGCAETASDMGRNKAIDIKRGHLQMANMSRFICQEYRLTTTAATTSISPKDRRNILLVGTKPSGIVTVAAGFPGQEIHILNATSGSFTMSVASGSLTLYQGQYIALIMAGKSGDGAYGWFKSHY